MCPGNGQLSIDEEGVPKIEIPHFGVATNSTHRLTTYENVLIQVAGQQAFSKEAYPYKDVGHVCWTITHAFHPKRLLWASDFPWIPDDPGYGGMVQIIDELLPNLGELAKKQLMGDNASGRLGFPPVA